jgi:hypothetical protein
MPPRREPVHRNGLDILRKPYHAGPDRYSLIPPGSCRGSAVLRSQSMLPCFRQETSGRAMLQEGDKWRRPGSLSESRFCRGGQRGATSLTPVKGLPPQLPPALRASVQPGPLRRPLTSAPSVAVLKVSGQKASLRFPFVPRLRRGSNKRLRSIVRSIKCNRSEMCWFGRIYLPVNVVFVPFTVEYSAVVRYGYIVFRGQEFFPHSFSVERDISKWLASI